MKQGLFKSCVSGITDQNHGESYASIIRYGLPEFITALLLYSMPYWIDSMFISHLQSTSTYATLGVTNNLLHLIIKAAEAVSVSTIVLSGRFNGMGEHSKVGQVVRDAFWVTVILGTVFASFLYFGAHPIYTWYNVSDKMIALGIPFLRLRAIGVFFTFIYFALIGFLRGVKNTQVPMFIFIFGSLVFLFFDYALIFGRFGFPALGLQGSAWASVIQYGVMLCAAIAYVVCVKKNHKYGIHLFSGFKSSSYIKTLLWLSWPVILDKMTMAWAYVWLCRMLGTMGKYSLATFCVIKDMERFAILPAIAGAQVLTFLVTNDFGAKNWAGIKSNIKKVLFLSACIVLTVLVSFSIMPQKVICFFDKKSCFIDFASQVFPLLSTLVFFDLLQIVLSGAMRGAGSVKTVMLVRVVVCLGYFVPVSYTIAQMPIESDLVKFVLIYGSFYVGNALMSIVYINRLRGEAWKEPLVKGQS